MNKTINQTVFHGVFWATVLVMISLLIIANSPLFVQFRQFTPAIRYIGLFTLIIGILAFYLSFIVVKLYRKGGRPYLKNLIIAVIIVGLTIIYLFLILSRFPVGTRNMMMAAGPRPLLAFIPVIFFSAMGIIFQGYQYSTEQKENQQQLEREKLDLELLVIKNQLNPHFLFNTLNNIDSFIKKDPQKASDAIIRLSVILRYLLYESDRDKVFLEEDIKIIEEYLELQKIRYGDHAEIHFNKNTGDMNPVIAPGIIIPFIENAFKHSPVNRKRSTIKIDLEAGGNSIKFSIRNEKKGSDESKANSGHGGIGLELARKRLEIIYADSFQLDIFDRNNEFTVELTISNVGI